MKKSDKGSRGYLGKSVENSLLKIMKYGSGINPSIEKQPQQQAPTRTASEVEEGSAGAQSNLDPEGLGRGAADAIGQFAGMMAGGKKGRWQYEDEVTHPTQGGGTGGGEEAPIVPPSETPSGPAGGDTTQTQQTQKKVPVPDQFEAPNTTQNQPNPTQNQQKQTFQVTPPPTGNQKKVTVPNV